MWGRRGILLRISFAKVNYAHIVAWKSSFHLRDGKKGQIINIKTFKCNESETKREGVNKEGFSSEQPLFLFEQVFKNYLIFLHLINNQDKNTKYSKQNERNLTTVNIFVINLFQKIITVVDLILWRVLSHERTYLFGLQIQLCITVLQPPCSTYVFCSF